MRKLIAVMGLSAVLLLGACGGGDSDNDNDTAAGGTTTTAVAGSNNNGGGGGGGGNSAFCAARAGFTPPNPSANSSDLKSSMEEAEQALSKAAAASPSEIRADVAVVADAYKKFIAAMKAANYDFTKVNANEMQAISSTEVQAAGQRITEWVAKNCS